MFTHLQINIGTSSKDQVIKLNHSIFLKGTQNLNLQDINNIVVFYNELYLGLVYAANQYLKVNVLRYSLRYIVTLYTLYRISYSVLDLRYSCLFEYSYRVKQTKQQTLVATGLSLIRNRVLRFTAKVACDEVLLKPFSLTSKLRTIVH